MTRFGDFTLLEELGRSGVADRYKAMHATQGGPFFLKVYSRLDATLYAELVARCEALMGRNHPNLAPHLGHGAVDGLPFVVAPYLDGIDLAELSTSLLDRRVTIGLESVLLVLADLTVAVGALHDIPAPDGHRNGTPLLSHGDVSLSHVRLGGDGQVWLTGLTTPRSETPGRPPASHWDLAGVGALVYDLVPLLRGGAQRPPLPAPLDRVVRRALGIGPAADRIGPAELADRIGEVTVALKLKPDRAGFAELIRRTVRAVEKRVAEARPATAAVATGKQQAPQRGGRASPADAIPSLDPVGSLPTLEPMVARAVRAPAFSGPSPQTAPKPAPILELIPLDAPSSEIEAQTHLLAGPALLAAGAAAPARLAEGAAGPVLLAQGATGPRAQPAVAAPGFPASMSSSPMSGLHSSVPGRDTGLMRTDTPAIIGRVETMGPPRTSTASMTATASPSVPLPRRLTPTALDVGLRASDDDPFASPPHTDPRAVVTQPSQAALQPLLPRVETPLARLGPTPFTDLPPDVEDAPPSRSPTTPPARPRAPPKRPLLADPEDTGIGLRPFEPAPPAIGVDAGASGGAAAAGAARDDAVTAIVRNPALDERTRDATDPDQRASKANIARNDPAVIALVRLGIVNDAAVNQAINEHAARGGRVVEILVAQGAVSDDAVADALAQESNRTRLSDDTLKARMPPASLVRRLPQTYVLARRVLPLSLEGGVLTVAVADPFDQPTIEELKNLLGAAHVEPVVAARAVLTAAAVDAYRNLGIGGVPGTVGGGTFVLLCTPDDAKAARIGARLVPEGMRVEHVVDGKSAMDIISNRPPDVVICAHDLAVVNAAALLLFAREQPRTADTPFFVFGPRGDEQLASRLLDLGADDFLSEPLKLEVLLSKVRRATRKGRSSNEGGALNDPSVPMGFALPSSQLDEATPIAPIETLPPAGAYVKSKAEPSFLENIAMPSLEDLPELPPDFSQNEPEMPSMPTGVMGTLTQMALPEIVQTLEMGRKTARVDLVPADGGEKGMIAFEMGQIRYAECGALRGDDAFYMLARHTEGFFRIHYGDKPPEINIEHPTTFLLLEAMRRMDEEGQNGSGGP